MNRTSTHGIAKKTAIAQTNIRTTQRKASITKQQARPRSYGRSIMKTEDIMRINGAPTIDEATAPENSPIAPTIIRPKITAGIDQTTTTIATIEDTNIISTK